MLLLVEGLDLLGDGEVLVGNGSVGDPGVDQGHGHGLVPEQRGDRLEAHAAVDGLGRQGVPELVGWTCPIPAAVGGGVDGVVDPGAGDGSAAVGEQQPAVLPVGSGREPLIDHGFQLRVQWDVAVVVEFADRDPQPVGGADLDDGVGGEAEEFPFAHPGAGEDLDREPAELVGAVARAAAMNLALAASSRNLGSGLSLMGRSEAKTGGRAGVSG